MMFSWLVAVLCFSFRLDGICCALTTTCFFSSSSLLCVTRDSGSSCEWRSRIGDLARGKDRKSNGLEAAVVVVAAAAAAASLK